MIHQLKKITPPGLETAIKLCRDLVSERVQAHFNNISFDVSKWYDHHSHQLSNDPLEIIPDINGHEAWVTVMITLIPHVQPNFFESIILEHLPNGGDFPEIGGVKATNHRSMLPTGETLQFILAGTSVTQRVRLQQLFSQDHFFHRQGIIWLENVKEGEPMMSGRLILSAEWVDKILLGKESPPRFGPDFPAKKIETGIQWDDVVLHPRTMNQINDIRIWLLHHDKFNSDANLKVKIKPGYRVLFYGPPGTGKTLTAALLGKEYNKDVYRIDLSQIVSKYIGETEKNLENVFRKAETKDWILFFDEADALFGKRTNVQSAHDKYANQEVSYLLQRVEDFPGLMILASNFKNNLDDAFLRRFHSVVHFPMPNATERQNLWNKTLPAGLKLDASINLTELSEQFELTGASILSAVHYATLQSYEREDGILFHTDLIDGIRKEFLKEEKSIDN
jgi:adenylate kinase family enzyme